MGEFDRDRRRIARHMGQSAGFQTVEILAVRALGHFDCTGEGADKTIGQQNAQERTHERAADQLAENFRRFGDRAHGFNNTQHRSHNSECGEAVTKERHRRGNLLVFHVMDVEFLVHQGFEFVWVFCSQSYQSQIVTEKLDGVMVVLEFWKVGKQLAFVRVLDMRFEREIALGLGELECGVCHRQKFDEVCFRIDGALERGLETFARGFENVFGIRSDIGTDPGATDNDQLKGLKKHNQFSAHGNVSAQDGSNHDEPSDKYKHGLPSSVGVLEFWLSQECRRVVKKGFRLERSLQGR